MEKFRVKLYKNKNYQRNYISTKNNIHHGTPARWQRKINKGCIQKPQTFDFNSKKVSKQKPHIFDVFYLMIAR